MWIIDSRCRVEREPVAGDLVAVTSRVTATAAAPGAAAPLFPGTVMTVRSARASLRGAGP